MDLKILRLLFHQFITAAMFGGCFCFLVTRMSRLAVLNISLFFYFFYFLQAFCRAVISDTGLPASQASGSTAQKQEGGGQRSVKYPLIAGA